VRPIELQLLSALADAIKQASPELRATPPVIAVACSGGLDSMCLADALVELSRPESGLHLPLKAVIFTVDHGLHERSASCAEGVVQHWRSRGVEAYKLLADPELIKAGRGLEDGARRARYAALERAMEREGCALLLLAHHASDQAETLLMRLQGPTGLGGLGGIPRQRGQLLRPWLDQAQEALKSYAQARELPIFEDPTNADPRWLRNRLRLRALPALERCFEPEWTLRFQQSASYARDAHEASQWFVSQALIDRAFANQHRAQLSWPEGLKAPRPAQELALLSFWRAAWARLHRAGREPRRLREHLPILTELWRGDSLTQHQLPHGLWAWGRRGELTIESRVDELSSMGDVPTPLLITRPQRYAWREWSLELSLIEGTRSPHSIPLSRAPLPWSLRRPRSGERLHLLGAPGSKPLRQLWARAGVAPVERETLPALVDGEDRVIWAPHLRPADHLRGGAGARWEPSFELSDPLLPLELTSP